MTVQVVTGGNGAPRPPGVYRASWDGRVPAGVDLGTTWTAAAVARGSQVTVVSLSQRSPAVPTVVHVAVDGSTLVGDAAVRRGLTEPERVGREKRRIGDPAPILLGGSPWSPEQLQTRVLRWVVDQVTAEQGVPPASVTVTHPANWGPFKLDLLAQAARPFRPRARTMLNRLPRVSAWRRRLEQMPTADPSCRFVPGRSRTASSSLLRRAPGTTRWRRRSSPESRPLLPGHGLRRLSRCLRDPDDRGPVRPAPGRLGVDSLVRALEEHGVGPRTCGPTWARPGARH